MSGALFAALRRTGPRTLDGGSSRFFRPLQTASELPRGITSDHDVLFDEATQTLSTRGGPTYPPLWDWEAERHGAARHAARTQTRTVTATGTAGWTEFLGYVSDFVAGSGDWEIRLPAAVTMTSFWTAPTGVGMNSRRLYLTTSAALPTANAMPTTAQIDACTTITGPTSSGACVLIDGHLSCKTTWTGIHLKANGSANVGMIDIRNHTTAPTVLAECPSEHVFDRCWVDGDGRTDVRRGIPANGYAMACLETWITDIRSGDDTQAWSGWTGCKYHFLRNVFGESSSIVYLYGGADPHQGNSGLMDPSDHLYINTVASKKLSWVTPTPIGIKNGYEAKNCSRWFILNSITHRHIGTAQTHAMLFQNVSDTNLNRLANRIEDIVVHNHEFVDCQNGLNLASRIGSGTGYSNGVQTGTTIDASGGYSTWVREDDFYNGMEIFVRGGAGVGQTAIVVDYIGATETFVIDTSWTLDATSWISAREHPLPSNRSTRNSFTNFYMRGMGRYTTGGYSSNPLQILGDYGALEIDQWTWTLHDETYNDILRMSVSSKAPGPLFLRRFAGKTRGLFGEAPGPTYGQAGFSLLNQCFDSWTWEGHSMYGDFLYGGTHTPGLTRYSGNGSLAADAAAMGFDTATGEISGAGADDGLSGGAPGCDFAQLEAAISPMASWAYSR